MQPDPVAVVGHEVRNLIATFVGFSELLLSQDWPREKQREYLEMMRDEGLRVSQFVNDLLDLQRMEAGATIIKPRPTDLANLLQFAADLAAHDAKHPIVLDVPEDLPMAMAEPDRIQQVLGNLLSNARKYSPQGGQITVSARKKSQGCLEVSVRDSGVGIPPKALEHVFDKFFRVESLAHRDIRGTGLGLAISREIVEGHGGRIWADSAGLGQGAQFTFSLPSAPTTKLLELESESEKTLAGSRGLDSRSEHVTAGGPNARYARRLSRSTASQSSRSSRTLLPAGNRSATHG